MKTAAACLAGALAACVSRPEAPERPGLVRLGPERLAVAYPDPHAVEKTVLFDRINRDRAFHGAPPLAYDPRAALAGDLFCRDAARTRTRGHWDAAGRAPYLRWGQLRGVDYHAQNAAAYSNRTGRLSLPFVDLLLERHAAMMAEKPPDDGHRRAILDPAFTHVGIGLGVDGGEFRMTEEFTRVAFAWLDVPERPLPVGAVVTFGGRPLPGWQVGLVEVRYEPPPRPFGPLDPHFFGGYFYPPVIRTLRPAEDGGHSPPSVGRGDSLPGRGGRFSFSFRLDRGPGSYFVLCYLRREGREGDLMRPATAALVVAGPWVY